MLMVCPPLYLLPLRPPVDPVHRKVNIYPQSQEQNDNFVTSFSRSSCSAPCFGFTLFLPTPQTNLIVTHYDRYHLHIVNFIPAVLIFSHYRQFNLELTKVTDIFTQHPIINFRQLSSVIGMIINDAR